MNYYVGVICHNVESWINQFDSVKGDILVISRVLIFHVFGLASEEFPSLYI